MWRLWSKIYFIRNHFLQFDEGRSEFLLIIVQKVLSFHVVVVWSRFFFSFIQIAFGHAVCSLVFSFCLWLFIVNLINFYSVAKIIACPKLFAWTHPKDDKNNLNKTSKLQLHEMSSLLFKILHLTLFVTKTFNPCNEFQSTISKFFLSSLRFPYVDK